MGHFLTIKGLTPNPIACTEADIARGDTPPDFSGYPVDSAFAQNQMRRWKPRNLPAMSVVLLAPQSLLDALIVGERYDIEVHTNDPRFGHSVKRGKQLEYVGHSTGDPSFRSGRDRLSFVGREYGDVQ